MANWGMNWVKMLTGVRSLEGAVMYSGQDKGAEQVRTLYYTTFKYLRAGPSS